MLFFLQAVLIFVLKVRPSNRPHDELKKYAQVTDGRLVHTEGTAIELHEIVKNLLFATVITQLYEYIKIPMQK